MHTSTLSPEIVLLLLALVAGSVSMMRSSDHTEGSGNRSDRTFLMAVGAILLLGLTQLLR